MFKYVFYNKISIPTIILTSVIPINVKNLVNVTSNTDVTIQSIGFLIPF